MKNGNVWEIHRKIQMAHENSWTFLVLIMGQVLFQVIYILFLSATQKVGTDRIFIAKETETERLSELSKAIQLINNGARVLTCISLYISCTICIFSPRAYIYYFWNKNNANF